MKVKVGNVYNYFIHAGVMALTLENELKLGDIIVVRGNTTNLIQTVESIQIEYLPVKIAKPGETVGIKADERVNPGDTVYKIE